MTRVATMANEELPAAGSISRQLASPKASISHGFRAKKSDQVMLSVAESWKLASDSQDGIRLAGKYRRELLVPKTSD